MTDVLCDLMGRESFTDEARDRLAGLHVPRTIHFEDGSWMPVAGRLIVPESAGAPERGAHGARSDNLFRFAEPAESGRRFAAVIPWPSFSACCDLLALDPESEAWWSYRGLADALGAWRLGLDEAPVRLHATPRSWLRNFGRGVWLADPKAWKWELMRLAELTPEAGWSSHVVCDDRAHAEAIHATLRKREKTVYPEIGFVRAKQQSAA